MNRYGRLAQQHWARWRPNQLSQIPDPEDFFSMLGQQAEQQIDELAASLPAPLGSTYTSPEKSATFLCRLGGT